MIPVILAGGSGLRLWPLSRQAKPKQFQNFFGDRSLLQETLLRFKDLDTIGSPVVVANAENRFLVTEHLRHCGQFAQSTVLLEPIGRNTAPAIAVAALWVASQGDDTPLLILPADHWVSRPDELLKAVVRGSEIADSGKLVTFSIKPHRPETGYGYIKRGTQIGDDYCEVESFVEKPDRDVAEMYLKSGDYVWNSGMFMFRPSAFLEQLGRYAPDILTACRLALENSESRQQFISLPMASYSDCPSVSVDYAVLEYTQQAVTLEVDCGWSDIGSWQSLWQLGQGDTADGNVCCGDVVTHQSYNNYIRSESRLVAACGVSDLAVIETADAVLVTSREASQQVNQLVKTLIDKNREETRLNRRVDKPWGYYQNYESGEGFLVKKLCVLPGHQLSLQKHSRRSEHWIVAKGTATVQLDGKSLSLGVGEHVDIAQKSWHRLGNDTQDELILLEVQLGEKLAETDIERAEDDYDRAGLTS